MMSPIDSIRDFVDTLYDQISRLPDWRQQLNKRH
jgi:hypothetical protein